MMTAVEIIRKALDYGYEVRLNGDTPRFVGKSPIPDQLLTLGRSHRGEIIAELKRRRDEGELPPVEKLSSKELQRWLIVMAKAGRPGMVMIDGVPVGIRQEVESLLAAEEAWEGNARHSAWCGRVQKLRSSLEWPVEEPDG